MDPNTNLDKFSYLPLHLVIVIISALSLADAFRLCVLRKEWFLAKLWTNCGSVELHEASFNEEVSRRNNQWRGVGQSSRANVDRDIGKLRFVNFLNETLLQITTPVLSGFSIQMSFDPKYRGYIDLWIAYALSKRVSQFFLDFSEVDPLRNNNNNMPDLLSMPQYVLPQIFYDDGESVKVLRLTACCLTDYNFYAFKILRVLVMKRVFIATTRVTEMLLSCPCLEDLLLIECFNLCKVELCYGLHRLKRLVVKHCGPLSEGIELIDLPMLEYFEYVGGFVTFEIDGLDELEEVVLDFQVDAHRPRQFEEIREAIFGFMETKILAITTFVFKVLPHEYMSNPPLLHFIHLQQLTLITCMRTYELPGILSLLRSAPNLKWLCISSVFIWPKAAAANDDNVELPDGFWTPQGWTLEHMECVQVDGFTGNEYELELLKFFMRNARNLHKMTITPRVGGNAFLYLDVFRHLEHVQFASECVFIEWCCVEQLGEKKLFCVSRNGPNFSTKFHYQEMVNTS